MEPLHPVNKGIFRKIWPWLWIRIITCRLLLHRKTGYLISIGWERTLLYGFPCDKDGKPIPWMNYPVITFLRQRLALEHRLFEYGSGYSTLFYIERVGSVVSVEYDPQWGSRIASRIGARAQLLYCPKDIDGRYCRMIHEAGVEFDVVVVDGADRINCFREALLVLSRRGVVIVDDAHRARAYAPIFDMAREAGFRHLFFEGMKPGGYGELVSTAIFYRDNNCFVI